MGTYYSVVGGGGAGEGGGGEGAEPRGGRRRRWQRHSPERSGLGWAGRGAERPPRCRIGGARRRGRPRPRARARPRRAGKCARERVCTASACVCVCARTALSVRAWVLRGARGACAKRRYRCVPALLGAVGACVCVRVCAGSPRGVRVRAWGISACARCACSCVQGASVSARRACVGCVHRASVRVKDTRAGGVSVHAWSAQCLHRHCLCACVCVRCIWGAWCVPAVVSARRVCVCVHGVSVCVHAAYPCAHGAGCELSVGVRVSWRAASRKAEAQPEMGSAGGEKLGGGGGGRG